MDNILSEKKVIEINIDVVNTFMKKMEEEFTELLDRFYSKSPYKRWETQFRIESSGYEVHVGLSPNPHYITVYLREPPNKS